MTRRQVCGIAAVVVLVAVGVLLASWTTTPSSIDGWATNGQERSCDYYGLTESACATLVDDAVTTMHGLAGAKLTGWTLRDYMGQMVNGHVQLMTMSGHTISGLVVARFADGSLHAAMFGCVGVAPPSAVPPCQYGRPIGAPLP